MRNERLPTVEVPDDPPELTTPLARVLFRILVRADEVQRPAADARDAIAS